MKDGAQLVVTADNIEAVNQDIENGSSFITVALAGDNALPTIDASQALEQKHLDAEPDLMALICGNRMRHDRREASLKPMGLAWEVNEDNVTLKFSLDAGCFATAIVRELVEEVHVERSYEQ